MTTSSITSNTYSASNTASSAASSTNASSTDKAKKSLSQTYDTFLTLLTTQLKNQDPLSPMDSAKFTEQLVQYSEVEQSINQNTNLEKIYSLIQGNQSSSALGYIGKTVSVDSATATNSGSGVTWSYNLANDAASNTLVVSDANGKLVYTEDGDTSSGTHSFAWDGKDSGGNTLRSGDYTLQVVAKDGSKATVTSTVTVGGVVTGVESGTDGPVLVVGGSRLPASKVVSVTDGA
jgi:flagellar basal-body rod modification protein FlgD